MNPFNDETSGIDNLKAAETPDAPIIVALLILLAVFCLGGAAGAVLTLFLFHL